MKTNLAAFKSAAEAFLSQPGLSQEEKLDGQLQLVKMYSYFGECYEAHKLIQGMVPEAKALEASKIKAKVLFVHILELKKGLVFNECKRESEEYNKLFTDLREPQTWKYLYKI